MLALRAIRQPLTDPTRLNDKEQQMNLIWNVQTGGMRRGRRRELTIQRVRRERPAGKSRRPPELTPVSFEIPTSLAHASEEANTLIMRLARAFLNGCAVRRTRISWMRAKERVRIRVSPVDSQEWATPQ